MGADKELIWVPKDLAEQFQKLDSHEKQLEMVLEIIRRKKSDFMTEQEMLDEDLLEFKAVCLKHRKELETVYDEQAKKLEDLWKSQGDISSKINQHAKEVAGQLRPITHEVSELTDAVNILKKALDNIQLHIPHSLVQVAETISHMDEHTKEVLHVVLTSMQKGDSQS